MFAEWIYKAGRLMTRERAALSASVLMFIGLEVLLVAGSIVLSVSVLMFIGWDHDLRVHYMCISFVLTRSRTEPKKQQNKQAISTTFSIRHLHAFIHSLDRLAATDRRRQTDKSTREPLQQTNKSPIQEKRKTFERKWILLFKPKIKENQECLNL